MTPSQLHASCPEYKAFKLNVFKQHISQEVRQIKFVNSLEWKQVQKRHAFKEEAAKKRRKIKKEERVTVMKRKRGVDTTIVKPQKKQKATGKVRVQPKQGRKNVQK
jgi:hypothetical protein